MQPLNNTYPRKGQGLLRGFLSVDFYNNNTAVTPSTGITAVFFIQLSVAAATAVVLIASAVVVMVTASVVTCKNEDKDDEEYPIAVASVTE